MANIVVRTLVDELNVFDEETLSIREAISLASNNGEEDVITFDPSLAGGVIVVTGALQFADNELLVINGDLDGDGVADITIAGDPNAPSGNQHLLRNYGNLSINGVDVTGGYAAPDVAPPISAVAIHAAGQ